MIRFREYHPITVTVWFLSVAATAMILPHPAVQITAFFASVALLFICCGEKHPKTVALLAAAMPLIAVINPIFNHRGDTVLFIVNDSPVTLEATVYGAISACMIVSVLLLFRALTQIMTSDRIICLFGSFSPKTALMLSLALRYVPFFGRQAKKITDAQKALGNGYDDSAIGRIKSGVRVFSVMVTWSLENGIITADSMEARGYGTGKRSFYSPLRFRKSDAVFLSLSLLLAVLVTVTALFGGFGFEFYPVLCAARSPLTCIGVVCYAVLSFLPVFNELEANAVWKYLKSKI